MDIKRVIRLVIFCAMACFSAALQQAAEINGLVGEYYANRTLEGQPVYRLDEKIDFDWENNSPMVTFRRLIFRKMERIHKSSGNRQVYVLCKKRRRCARMDRRGIGF